MNNIESKVIPAYNEHFTGEGLLKFKEFSLSNVDIDTATSAIEEANTLITFSTLVVNSTSEGIVITGEKGYIADFEWAQYNLDRYDETLMHEVIMDIDTTLGNLMLTKVALEHNTGSKVVQGVIQDRVDQLSALEEVIELIIEVNKFKWLILEGELVLGWKEIDTYANLEHHKLMGDKIYTLEGYEDIKD